LYVKAKGGLAADKLAKGLDQFGARRLQVVRALRVTDQDAVAVSVEQLLTFVRELDHRFNPLSQRYHRIAEDGSRATLAAAASAIRASAGRDLEPVFFMIEAR